MKIAILGTGAYGIALAKVFYNNSNKVKMWTKFQEELDIITLKRENKKVLPKVKIPEDILLTCDMKECVKDADIIVLAIPMCAIRQTSIELSKYIKPEQIICMTSKGIEEGTNKLTSQIIEEIIENDKICMLSGPSFAIELVNNIPSGIVVASRSSKASMMVKLCLENEKLSVITLKDIVGVQVSSSAKNVFAIIMGILDGLNVADSTRASMLTILLRDLKNIVEILGGKSNTVDTYAGIGDFLLTCMSNKSRNYTFGKNIGLGYSIKKSYENMNNLTVEGLTTLESIYKLLNEKQINIDSINKLYNILYNDENPSTILECIK